MFTGATASTFQRCSRSSSSQTFTLTNCPVGDVIDIRSAEVGFNTRWNFHRSKSSTCSRKNVMCWRYTRHSVVMACSGQRTCSFSSRILRFPQSNAQRLCSRHRDANFITISYQCTSSGIIPACFSMLLVRSVIAGRDRRGKLQLPFSPFFKFLFHVNFFPVRKFFVQMYTILN